MKKWTWTWNHGIYTTNQAVLLFMDILMRRNFKERNLRIYWYTYKIQEVFIKDCKFNSQLDVVPLITMGWTENSNKRTQRDKVGSSEGHLKVIWDTQWVRSRTGFCAWLRLDCRPTVWPCSTGQVSGTAAVSFVGINRRREDPSGR